MFEGERPICSVLLRYLWDHRAVAEDVHNLARSDLQGSRNIVIPSYLLDLIVFHAPTLYFGNPSKINTTLPVSFALSASLFFNLFRSSQER